MNSTNSSLPLLCHQPLEPTGEEKGNLTISGSIEIILAIFIIAGNCIVFYVFIIKQKRFKDLTDVLLILLGVSDILIGIFVLPCMAYLMFALREGDYLCHLGNFIRCVGSTLIHCSLAIIGFITFEMYMKLVNPMTPRTLQTSKVLWWVGFMWVSLAVFSIIFFYVLEDTIALFSIITTAVLIIMYIFISMAHYKINKEIQGCQNRQNGNPSIGTIQLKKTLKMSFSILVAFGICILLPIATMLVLNYIEFENSLLKVHLKPWLRNILYLNAFVDPIIYCMRMKSVRKEVYKTIFCKNKVTESVR